MSEGGPINREAEGLDSDHGDNQHDPTSADTRIRADESQSSTSPAATANSDLEKPAPSRRSSRLDTVLDLAAHWSWITIFSILGTLTRLGLESLNEYPGSLIPPLIWAQFVGCVVMGFITHDEILFPENGRNDPLLVGLTTGYCGSVTSFSAWILQVFQDLANTEGAVRSRGYSVISVITQVMITLTSALAAYEFGKHIAFFTNTQLSRRHIHPIPRLSKPLFILALVGCAIGCQAGTIVTAGVRREWRGIVAFAMVFSPAGALTRWHLSRLLNKTVASFPMGTFSANVAGSVLESIFHLLQFRVANGNACSILQGLQDGYCGTLTTVSTFIVELCTLRKRHAYVYAVTSIVLASVLYVLVDGIDFWIHGSAAGYFPRCTF